MTQIAPEAIFAKPEVTCFEPEVTFLWPEMTFIGPDSGRRFGVAEIEIYGTGNDLNRKKPWFSKIFEIFVFQTSFFLELGQNSKIGLRVAHYPCL